VEQFFEDMLIENVESRSSIDSEDSNDQDYYANDYPDEDDESDEDCYSGDDDEYRNEY
jgi:hypothetical protein